MLALYLLKFSISIAIVYLFYQLVLRRLTFYAWNRLYLFGYCLLSFAIPFINISPLTQQHHFDNTQLIRYIPVIENYTAASPAHAIVQNTIAKNHSINGWQIFYAILIIGSVIMLIRLITQLISLQKIKKSATIIHDEEAVIYNVDKKITPFSFGNAIYINQDLHSEKELQEIILHEYVHVKQKHTADIILSELICIINWYNPFAWLMRHAIRQNLEFIADNKVLQHGTDKRSYQYHLIKVVGSPQYRIANNFNFSSLKKRIAMMNKIKSAKLHLLRFLFLLPLLAVLLLAFRKIIKEKDILIVAGIVVNSDGYTPISGAVFKDEEHSVFAVSNEKGFYSYIAKKTKESDTAIALHVKISKGGFENREFNMSTSINNLINSNNITIIGLHKENVSDSIFGFSDSKCINHKPFYKDASEYLDEHINREKIRKEIKISQHVIAIIKGVTYIILKDCYGSTDSPNPQIFVDGKQMTVDEINKKIARDRIFTFYIKDSKIYITLKKFDPKGRNGRIIIKNNSSSALNSPIISVSKKDTVPSNKDAGKIQLSKNTKQITFDVKKRMDSVLFILDDKEIDSSALSKLDVMQIESINILKDSSATNQYGNRASHGVIIITTKKELEKNKPAMNKKNSDVSFASNDKSEYENKINILWLLEEYINHPKYEYKLIPENLGIDGSALTKILEDYNDLQRQRKDTLHTTTENDISIKEIDDQLRKIRREITDKARDIRNEYALKLITKS